MHLDCAEHDGFDEATARGWFDAEAGFQQDSITVSRITFEKKLPPDWDEAEPTKQYTMMLITGTVA